jgi:signal transduction histidine kinase
VWDWIEKWRHRKWVAPLGDILLVAMVLALSLKGLSETNGCPCPPLPVWGYALVGVQSIVLLGRRYWPMTVALISGFLAMLYGVSSLPDPPVPYAALVAIYTAAARASQRRAILVAVISAAEIALAMILDRVKSDYQDALFNYLIFATAWLLGFAKSAHSERLAALEERATQLEQTHFLESARAVSEERNRISRELHDIVAHHVSMMVIQAEAAPLLLDKDPKAAADAMASISQTGRAALAEMRRMMALMREHEALPLSPQPNLSVVRDLIDGIRGSGLDVNFDLTGEVRALSQGTELTAYRLLQEALTNVAKHARGARADVRLDYGPEILRIDVRNDSAEPSGSLDLPGGNGLVVMRERVALLGGDLMVGPDEPGTWRVSAVLPVGAPAP